MTPRPDAGGDTVSIAELRERPEFAAIVADRIWTAWWREEGLALGDVSSRLQESLAGNGVPLTLIAHRGDLFLGTASAIASDMDERPHYTPWVAAVWVEREYRNRGIGSALVTTAVQAAFSLGIARLYLCAAPSNAPFYERMAWQRIEEDVGGLSVFALSRKPQALTGD